jgi:hypothetical protein
MSRVPSRVLIHCVEAYAGWHRLLGWLPHRVQARWVARAWLRQMPRIDPAGETALVVQFPFGAFRVLDGRGRVAPCPRGFAGRAGG